MRARASIELPLAFACLLAASAPSEPSHAQSSPSATTETTERARDCFDAGQSAYAKGRLNEAAKRFLCAYEQAPSPELAWNLGRVYERMGEAELGARYYRLFLTSGNAGTTERKDVQRRIRTLEALAERQAAQVKAAPPSADELGNEARAFFARGVTLYRKRRYEAALAAFSAALSLSQAAELHYNLALASERLGRREDALDHYRAYLQARPEASDRATVERHITQLRAAR